MTDRKYYAPRPTIRITKKIIERATRNSSSHCMIADAIRQQVQGASRISVDLQTIRWSDEQKGLRYTYLTPHIGQDALVRFDRGMKIPEFQFTLRGAHITSMLKGGRKKQVPRHKLGRRRIKGASRHHRPLGAMDTIGGKSPPKSPLHGHTRRKYGLRAYTLDDVMPKD
jgi:hypothetical protein